MHMNDYDEQAVIRAVQSGDRAAFGVLVKAYQRKAYAAAYSLTRNREDALELSQEAFVRAFRAMDRFDRRKPFYPWLYRIVRNACFNHLKKKKRHGASSLDSMMANGYDAQSEEPDPRDAMAFLDRKEAILEAMQRLTPDQQEILRLRHFLELSYAEIAACAGIPEGTVMSRLHAARKALGRILEEEKTPVNV
jgi:RNA polymerase sigma-70 factor, ECF subfamily